MRPQFLESRTLSWLCRVFLSLGVLAFPSASVRGQQQAASAAESSTGSLDDRLRTLQDQLVQLQSAMSAMHEEIARSRAESADLRREMEATRSLLAAKSKPGSASTDSSGVGGQKNLGESTSASTSRADQNSQVLEENQQLVNAKLVELHQTKVESGSKYRVRLSGIVLLKPLITWIFHRSPSPPDRARLREVLEQLCSNRCWDWKFSGRKFTALA